MLRRIRGAEAHGWLVAAVLLALIVGSSVPAVSSTAEPDDTGRRIGGRAAVLERWLADTWRSVDAMVVPETELPADKIGAALTPEVRARYTSPTNIATYVWSVVVARDTGLITAGDARGRVAKVLASLGAMDVHEPSGMFFNWYDPNTGDVITTWPEDGSTVVPFLSSVDNGWLASETDPGDCSVKGNDTGSDDPDVYYNCVHYGGLNNDPRIAYYAAIALGDLPGRVYYGLYRTFPDGPCADWGWTEQKATGPTRTYLGVPTFEGSYTYRGLRFVPSYGGSMFEALMADLVVPEDEWGPRSWGRTHPAFVQGQIEHGLLEARYGYWGFSPANNPFGGYGVYGVDAMGEAADGWTSDAEGTLVDRGWPGCRAPQPDPAAWGDGVVTPHASFLALRYAPRTAIANLLGIEHRLGAFGRGGFFDSVAVRSGTVSRWHLMLDQGMVLAALGNALADDTVRHHFPGAGVREVLRPLFARETFNVPAHQRRNP